MQIYYDVKRKFEPLSRLKFIVTGSPHLQNHIYVLGFCTSGPVSQNMQNNYSSQGIMANKYL